MNQDLDTARQLGVITNVFADTASTMSAISTVVLIAVIAICTLVAREVSK